MFAMQKEIMNFAAMVIVLLIGWYGISKADILHVPADYETIQEAVDASENGDIVLVAEGLYQEDVYVVNKSISICSHYVLENNEDHIRNTVMNQSGIHIDGSALYGPVSLIGFRFDRTWMSSTTSIVNIENIEFVNNTNRVVQSMRDRSLSIRNSLFSDNATLSYAIVYTEVVGSVEIDNCKFINNLGNNYATIYIGECQNNVLINNVDILHNSSRNGTIVFLRDVNAMVDITNSNISYNTPDTGHIMLLNTNGNLLIRDTEIKGNFARGKYLIHTIAQSTLLQNVIIADNEVETILRSGELIIENSTIVNNKASLYSLDLSDGTIIENSILYQDAEMAVSNLIGDLSINYSLVKGGRNAFNRVNFDWGEGNLEVDPKFLNSFEGDYSLDWNSPCIDAGNPDAEPDIDGTRKDIGSIPFLHSQSYIYGRVTEASNGNPLPFSLVQFEGKFTAVTNENGEFAINKTPIGMQTVTVKHPSHLDNILEFNELDIDDTLHLDIEMYYPSIRLDTEAIQLAYNYHDIDNVTLNIFNDGNGELAYQSEVLDDSERGMKKWQLRKEIEFENFLNDFEPRSVQFINGRFFLVCGTGQFSAFIYVLNHNGEVVYSFQHPIIDDEINYYTNNLVWDGNSIWGSNGRFAYNISIDGQLNSYFPIAAHSRGKIAWDEQRGIIWVFGSNQDFIAYDRDGNFLDWVMDRGGFQNVYGAAFYPNNPDGFDLYMYGLSNNVNTLLKRNTETGESEFVQEFQPTNPLLLNLQFTNEYDPANLVLVGLSGAERNRKISIHQVSDPYQWLHIEPAEAVIEPNSEGIITLSFTPHPTDSMGFNYHAEVVISNYAAGQVSLPVTLEVIPTSVSEKHHGLISDFTLHSAYPNPFNSMTKIAYSLPHASKMSLRVYDISGRLLETLVNGEQTAGHQSVIWDATGFATSVYFVQFEAGSFKNTQKLILIK